MAQDHGLRFHVLKPPATSQPPCDERVRRFIRPASLSFKSSVHGKLKLKLRPIATACWLAAGCSGFRIDGSFCMGLGIRLRDLGGSDLAISRHRGRDEACKHEAHGADKEPHARGAGDSVVGDPPKEPNKPQGSKRNLKRFRKPNPKTPKPIPQSCSPSLNLTGEPVAKAQNRGRVKEGTGGNDSEKLPTSVGSPESERPDPGPDTRKDPGKRT